MSQERTSADEDEGTARGSILGAWSDETRLSLGLDAPIEDFFRVSAVSDLIQRTAALGEGAHTYRVIFSEEDQECLG